VLSLGIGRAAFETTRRFVRDLPAGADRHQPQVTRFALADFEVELGTVYACAAQAVRHGVAGGTDGHLECTRFKLHATTHLAAAVARAAQLFGADGMTSRWCIERLFRDAQAVTAMGPANHLIREQVAQQILAAREEEESHDAEHQLRGRIPVPL
jgi:alkylation response protein AidB-like acyl-CoA dehydrogenase